MSHPHRYTERVDTYHDWVITTHWVDPGYDGFELPWRATVRRFGADRQIPVTFRAATEIEMVELAKKFVNEVLPA